MKIAVIGKKNHLYWDIHVAEAFKELGQEVFHFQINNRPLAVNIIRSIGKIFNHKEISDKLMALKLFNFLKGWKPDLIFLTSAFFIPIVYYQELKRLKVPIVAWDGDGGPSNSLNKIFTPFIDILFESELEYVKLNKLNFKVIEYLPFAANINMFKPIKCNRETYIFFAGAFSKKRGDFISAIDYPMKIRGWGWEKLEKKSNYDVENKKLNIDQMINEYNNTKIALNIHQEVNHINALNMRTFEVPACKTLLLCDYRRELDMHFENGKELLVFKDIEELQEKIDMLQEKEKIKKIAEAGYKKIINFHTYKHRMQKVLNYLDN